jgi:L-rhamnose mutarotase
MNKDKLISFKRYSKTMELRNDSALIEAYKKAHAKGAA